MDVGQAHVAAGEAHGQSFVIEAQQVEHGGVEIVDGGFALDHFVTIFVSFAVDAAAFDAATGQPDGKTERIVIASIGTLGEGCAPKFSGPGHEGVFQQATRLKVREQAGDGLIDGARVVFMARFETAVLVPAIGPVDGGAGQLDKPNAAFH